MQTITRIPQVTVHGRFQPPLHINHWEYIRHGFDRAEHVTILITNPFHDEGFDSAASWRSDPLNNPFSYDERAFMFDEFLKAMSISSDRYTVKPFNIKDPATFASLHPATPNIVNVYSEWSAKKLDAFLDHGLPAIRLKQPKSIPVSGTKLREIIRSSHAPDERLGEKLVQAGLMPEALPGLLQVLYNKSEPKVSRRHAKQPG